jgi:ATP-binding cassette subfamily B (MDR/TAP) protein 1
MRKQVPYHKAVGSLMSAAVSRCPDITFPMGILSKFLDNPGLAHWDVAKCVFHYLQGMKDWPLTYGTRKKGLEGYADANGMSQQHT